MAVSLVAAVHPRLAPGAGGIRILRNDGRNRRRVWCQSGGDGAPNPSDKVFIFGMGYTALALANTLQKRGWEVAGTCRSEEKQKALQQRGFRAHLFNDDERLHEEAILELQQATHIVSSIPPVGDFDCDPVLAFLRVEGLALDRTQWIGYLSSTSVYGDWQGGWVDEQTEPRPADGKASARREAESSWLRLGNEEAGSCVHVFRLGGIYGPGRSALDTVAREKMSARQRARAHKRFTSRVHVADICQVVVKAMAASRKCGSGVFNVVDDDPSPRSEVMAYARQLLLRPNPIEEKEIELGFASCRVAEKRVSNRRIKEELHVELLYPSFRSGLKAIAKESNDLFDC